MKTTFNQTIANAYQLRCLPEYAYNTEFDLNRNPRIQFEGRSINRHSRGRNRDRSRNQIRYRCDFRFPISIASPIQTPTSIATAVGRAGI